MEKRLIIAIALSALIIFVFQNYMKGAAPAPLPHSRPAAVSSKVSAPQATVYTPPAQVADVPVQPVKELEIETVIETDKFILTFTNVGAAIKSVILKEFRDVKTGKPLELVNDLNPPQTICAMQLQTPTAPLGQIVFDVEKKKNELVYTYTLPGRYQISKVYSFSKSNDYIGLRIFIKNITQYPLGLQYELLGPVDLETTDTVMGRSFLESDSKIDGKVVRRNKIKNGYEILPGIVSWTGIKNRYFSVALKPAKSGSAVILTQDKDKNLAAAIRTTVETIEPQIESEDPYVLYIGPSDLARLGALRADLEGMVNYGIFGGISILLLKVLRFFHLIVRNWGLAIIMLTVLVNIILFPLTRKSFISMRKMQEMQPHIEKLRKSHKDNPGKLNKELAELYRANSINPFGGCLPLFLQMPIFIALYQGLIKSIELKNANFLWIKDLSSPDAVALPFTLPLIGDHINILPLLMVVVMLVQQKVSSLGAAMSEEQKKQQQMMMVMFPLFFGFLFYNFPSGLVLYWLTNTVLTVIEHSMLKKFL